jgi:transposase
MTFFVGIDISKDKFDVSFKTTNNKQVLKSRIYDQNKEGLDTLISDIKSVVGDEKYFIGMEATSRYHLNLSDYLVKRGLPLVIFNPMETATVRKWNIRKAKSDSIDADVVSNALILEMMGGKKRYIANDDKLELKEFVTLYHRIVEKTSNLRKELRMCLNNLCPGYEQEFDDILSASSYSILKKAVKKTKLFDMTKEDILNELRKNKNSKKTREELASIVFNSFQNSTCPGYMIDARVFEVKSILGQYDVLKRQRSQIYNKMEKHYLGMTQYASSVDGVGVIIGATTLGILGDVNRFHSRNALDAYVGLDPVHMSSGKSLKRVGHISKRGNRLLRAVLIRGALSCVRHNPVIKKKYYELRARGKCHRTALVACARKLLHIIYSVEKNQKKFYIPEHVTQA